MTSECTISEEIIAIFGAIPSSILIYVSIYYDLFPRTASQITYVLAIAVGSTIALNFEALRLLVRPGKLRGNPPSEVLAAKPGEEKRRSIASVGIEAGD